MIGLEAGQSAFGDLYAWFKHLLMWPVENILLESEKLPGELREEIVGEISSQILKRLEDRAREIPAGQSGIVALDWINGRRTPDANQNLEAAVAGLDMGSDAPAIFKALVEATAFGAKEIVDRFVREGVEPREVIALGGVAKKSEFVMQTVADVLGLEIKVVESEQACALGAAMFAAVVCGAYADVGQAQKAMSSGFCARYSPDPAESAQYEKLHKKYKQLGAYAESLAADGHR
jgi:L-ribulokinase